MPDAPWRWDDHSKRYRRPNGRFISFESMVKLRDTFTLAMEAQTRKLAGQMTDGQIDLQRWVTETRTTVKVAFTDQYLLGRGGRKMMNSSDWGKVGAMLREQYQFLNRFAEDVAAGKLSAAQIAQRATMYADASTQAYERGKAAAWGIALPAYPADGSTRCLTNCRCSWRIEADETEVRAYWSLGIAEHCEDCLERAETWAPLTYPRR